MKAVLRWSAMAVAAASAGAFALQAAALADTTYLPPKLLHQGHTSKSIAGTGTVVVQVQVNPNGTHVATKVIRSTNSGDNGAAMEIAQTSTYRPARRGSQAVPAFYDFTLKFNGKSVAQSQAGPAGFSSSATSIDRLIRAGKYQSAKAAAEQALASHPNDQNVLAELGAADYFLNDYPSAADEFSKVTSLNPEFKQVATIAYVGAAKAQLNSNPTQAVTYAQKAVALAPSGNSYYMLGAAEVQAGNGAQAVGDLKRARDLVFADSKTTTKERVNVDGQLYLAYNKAGDSAEAQTTLDEMRRLDPSDSTISTYAANAYITQGQALEKAGKYQDAIAQFQQAASSGGPEAQVTGNTMAAFAMNAMLQSSKSASKTDYDKMKAFADKALAVKPDDPQANYAEGIALANEWVIGGKTDASMKSQALAALNKAKSSAQASGNYSLSLSIDNFIKSMQ